MELFQKARQVQKAVKNVGRLREILSTMSRYGFKTLIRQIGLSRFLDRSVNYEGIPTQNLSDPQRVRLLLQELGPTFIKFGQILAGRPDLIPVQYAQEFQKLQDKVKPVPYLEIKNKIEEALGEKVENLFSSFDPEALATASIAQVHSAKTQSGDDVVVKVIRPGVEETLRSDLEIFELLCQLAENYSPELKEFEPLYIFEEFRRTLLAEVNFKKEAFQMKRFQKNFENSDFLVIPDVHLELSSENVLTMEKLHGIKLQNVEKIQELGIDTKLLIKRGIECHLESILVHGLFHADPHGGNILVFEDGRMGLIDFGAVGYLSPKSKESVVNMFLALIAEDYDSLVTEYVALSPPKGQSRSSKNIDRIQRDVAKIFGPYYGLPLRDIPASELMLESASIAFKHRIILPQDMVMVFKSNMTLEGIGRQLDPDFDLLGSASKFAQLIIKERYSPDKILKSSLYTLRNLHQLVKNTPRLISESIRQLESGEVKINLQSLNSEKEIQAKNQASRRLSLSITFLGLVGASTALSFHPNIHMAILVSLVVLSVLVFLSILRSNWFGKK